MPGMSLLALGIGFIVVVGLVLVAGLAVGVSLGGMQGGYSKPSRLWFWRRGA